MKFKLKFQYKSNEHPWSGEFTAMRHMKISEALDWCRRYRDAMPDYIITLYQDEMMLDNQGERSIFDDVDQ